jgi:hypothetical protein
MVAEPSRVGVAFGVAVPPTEKKTAHDGVKALTMFCCGPASPRAIGSEPGRYDRFREVFLKDERGPLALGNRCDGLFLP